MGEGHYSSHLLAQATRDIEAARFEARRLVQIVAEVESFVEDSDLAREEAIQVWDKAIRARDEAIARTNSVESEWDKMVLEARAEAQAEVVDLQYQKTALDHLMLDIKTALLAE